MAPERLYLQIAVDVMPVLARAPVLPLVNAYACNRLMVELSRIGDMRSAEVRVDGS